MDDFDRLLELELVRMLDSVVRAPAPPRSSPPGRLVRVFTAWGSSIAPVASVVVLADAPLEQRSESLSAPAIFS